MSVVGLTVGLLTILIAGASATLLLTRAAHTRNLLECLCHSWLLGTGSVSLLLWIGGFFFSGIGLRLFVLMAVLGSAFAGWRTTRTRPTNFAFPRPRGPLEWLLAFLLAAELVAAFWLSLGQTLGWDGSFNWEIKARFAFLNDGVMPTAYFSSPSQTNTHPEYPLLIPFTQLWLDLWIGQAHQFWEKIVFPLFYATGTTLLALLGARLSGRRWAGGLGAVFLFFVPYLVRGAGGLRSGYLDLPLGVLYLAAIGYLLLHLRVGDMTSLRLAAAALALLPWMKREGTILWLIAVLCGAAVLLARKQSWRRWLLLFPGVFLIVGWNFYLRVVEAAPSHDFVPVSLATLRNNLSHIVPIARALLLEFGQTERWGIFWWLVLFAFVSRWWRHRDFSLLLLALALVAPVVLFSSSYLFSAWPDYQVHLHASLPRLLLQVTPLAWLGIALGLDFPGTCPNEKRATVSPPLAASRPVSS